MRENDARRALDEVTERLSTQHEKIVYLERVAGVLRAANAHLRTKLDKYIEQRDIYRAMADQASLRLGEANRRLIALGEEPVLTDPPRA